MEQITLGELINQVEKIYNQSDVTDRDAKSIYFNFCHVMPTDVSSFRGYYNELAINWTGGEYTSNGKPLSLKSFLNRLNEAVGESFTGWKGGEYIMGLDTPMWVANYGCVGDTVVCGVTDLGWAAIIETKYKEQ